MEKDNKILALLKELIALDSTTGSTKEQQAENFLEQHLRTLPYFQEHPAYCGQLPTSHDPYGRSIVYGLVRGKSSHTVILMNHHDVVSTECYGPLEPYAYTADKITELLKEDASPAGADFRSGKWLGGRGSCDMKGGMAAQLSYLAEYAKAPNSGSLFFLSVPDEESYSQGMRQALGFLQEAKSKWNLDYCLAINSEPNTREGQEQIVPLGSVGKILATVLVQGKTVHVSNYASGLNPLGILSGLVAATEGAPALQEVYKREKTVPPVWLRAREQKENYDVSLPARASGYCSFQAFNQGPEYFLELLKAKTKSVAENFSQSQPLAKTMPIYSYAEFLLKVKDLPNFASWQQETIYKLEEALNQGHITYPDATLKYLNALVDFSDYKEPLALLAFAPPYYPATNSRLMEKPNFARVLQALAKVQPVIFQEYFLGVSDCSYLGNTLKASATSFAVNTPLWGRAYSFEQAVLAQLQIPFLLLGPWGKDLHQRTERVNIDSLTRELPQALHAVITTAWQE